MQSRAIVTLLTDFGQRDPYVGVMKGVVLGIAPETTLVDLTHEVPPQDILHAAFALSAAIPYFPPATIHLAVVDPGVGTDRAAVVVRTSRSLLVAPDNGLLTLALQKEEPRAAWLLTNLEFFLPRTSRTFHGRDVFAPVAAHLAAGRDPAAMGEPLAPERLQRLDVPGPVWEGELLRVPVLYVDHFGNLVTALEPSHVRGRSIEWIEIKKTRVKVAQAYQEVGAGEFLAIWGSFGHLEISMGMGNASDALECSCGEMAWVCTRQVA